MNHAPPSPDMPFVTLVGAGPGDPELLTLKAVKAIAAATVILVDDLVHPDVLQHANPQARIIAVGKRGGCQSTPQAFIEKLMVQAALPTGGFAHAPSTRPWGAVHHRPRGRRQNHGLFRRCGLARAGPNGATQSLDIGHLHGRANRLVVATRPATGTAHGHACGGGAKRQSPVVSHLSYKPGSIARAFCERKNPKPSHHRGGRCVEGLERMANPTGHSTP